MISLPLAGLALLTACASSPESSFYTGRILDFG